MIFTDDDSRRIARAVIRVEHESRGGGAERGANLPVAPSVQLVRVTADPAVSGRYPAVVQDYDAATDSPADLDGGNCWAVAPAGETLAEGYYHGRRWGDFDGGSGALPTFTVAERVGADAVFTVTTVDASPSYSPVDTFRFDEADGFSISNPSAGIVRIDLLPASITQTGVITTGDQSFLGWKDFKTGVLVGRVNGGAGLTAEIHFHAFPGSDAREQSRIRIVEDVNHPGGDYQTMILTAGFGSFNYGAEKSAELWVDGENQCFRLYAWTGSSVTHKRPDLFIFDDAGIEQQGQTVTESGVTYTSGLRTGGSLSVAGSSLSGTVDGGTY